MLANTALDVSLVPAAPQTLTLAWLGVDQTCAGQGRGTKLFARALANGVRIHHLVRFVAVMVDALTSANAGFYQRQGFLPVPGSVDKLYLPATTLMQIVGGESAAQASSSG